MNTVRFKRMPKPSSGTKKGWNIEVVYQDEDVRMDIFVKMKTYPIRNGEIFDSQTGEYVPVLAAVRGAPLAVWMYLASCVDDVKRAWPSRETIAKATGYKKQTVTQAVSRLKELGLISYVQLRERATNQIYNMYSISELFFEYG